MRRLFGLCWLVLNLSGCAHTPSLDTVMGVQAHAPGVELTQVPFFPQEDYQCGPAALASALQFSGIPVVPDELTNHLFLPGKKGSLQIEILATARHHGRLPYPIEPDLPALIQELQNGHPVLVLQNLGFRTYPVWHYALVIGYEPDTAHFILRSGKKFRLRMPFKRFQDSWRAANNWGIIILKPGELPAKPRRSVYLAAAADLEALGQHQAAREAFLTAREAWQEAPEAWLGIANSEYALQRPRVAEEKYRELITRFPDYLIAYNNLAVILAERYCTTEALSLIRSAMQQVTGTSPIVTELRITEQEILRAEKNRPAEGSYRCEPKLPP